MTEIMHQLVQLELSKDLYRPQNFEVTKDAKGRDVLKASERPDNVEFDNVPGINKTLSPDAQAVLQMEFERVQAELATMKAATPVAK